MSFPFPKQVALFNASFSDVGTSEERLHLTWNYPITSQYPAGEFGEFSFLVGTECFLESPTSVTQVPEEHLIASCSMSAILGGEALPGSTEFLTAVTAQDTKNFQTIVGEVRLKPQTTSYKNPVAVSDTNHGPEGTVYDITFQKGSGSDIKVVRTDSTTLSSYSNRIDSVYHMVYCIPGALHKQFAFKKSDLGVDDSANRLAITDWLSTKRFWV